MNLDEFSFFNQQLAGMLKDGIPLESGLKQLCAAMKRDKTRVELEALHSDLAKGVPLKEALAQRQLPAFYKNLLSIGAQSNNLAGILLLAADYYARAHALGTRLKGLMVYPLIVLLAALALSTFLSFFSSALLRSLSTGEDSLFFNLNSEVLLPTHFKVMLWLFPAFLALAVVVMVCGLMIPAYRRYLRWRTPGFREASISQTASTMSLLLRGGSDLGSALSLVRQLEQNSIAGRDIAVWEQRLASGQGKFVELAQSSRAFPPLFVWLVANGGEDLAAGFARAAEIYYARAVFRAEMILYAVLPISVFALGMMILSQYVPLFRAFNYMMNVFGSFNGM